MSGPLEGVKIIDLSTIVSGPLAGSLLGDQGADVIKIESPNRPDNARFMGPIRGENGALFAAANRSKRSLALDLKKEGSLDVIFKLIEGADVILDNFRPGILKKLGLDYENLKKYNSKIEIDKIIIIASRILITIQTSIPEYIRSGVSNK